MIAGLSPLDLGRLRMSVGYATHKKGRPFSPVEVAKILFDAHEEGASWEECASAVHLKGTSQVRRFQKIRDLPEDLQHLVDWGESKDSISFSSAVELTRFRDLDDQRIVANSILTDGLGKKEVQQIAQLHIRSGRTIVQCIAEILGMRPIIERRYIFIGSIIDSATLQKLSELTQSQQNSLLKQGVDHLNLKGASGRLRERFFTLVGDEKFNDSMTRIGKDRLEEQLRSYISKVVNCAPN